MLGDCLFAHALKLAASFPTPEICRAVAAATNTVCAGEILQTRSRGDFDVDPRPLFQNAGHEDGRTLRLVLRFGRVPERGHRPAAAGPCANTAWPWARLTSLYDDCLDLLGSEAAAGKTLGADLAKGKMTLPLLIVRDRASAEDQFRLRQWLANWEPAVLAGVIELIVKYDAFTESRAIVQQYLVAARQALMTLPPSEGRSGLMGLTEFFGGTNRGPGGCLLVFYAMQKHFGAYESINWKNLVTRPPPPEPPDGPEGEEVADLTLVRRAQRDDVGAYDELVRRYQERIYATVYHMTSNHEDANDLVQETFIKAFRALKSFKGDSSFYTWIYRIAVNKTINFLKQRKNRLHMSLNDVDFNAENDPDLVALVSEKTPRRDLNLSELQEKLNAPCSNCQNTTEWL